METKTIFNANQLRGNKDIKRRRDLDFDDDGTHFNFYSYKDVVGFHIARWKDYVFICIRPSYTHEVNREFLQIQFEVYRNWDIYPICDEFNCVKEDAVDLNRFYENLETVYQYIINHQKQ